MLFCSGPQGCSNIHWARSRKTQHGRIKRCHHICNYVNNSVNRLQVFDIFLWWMNGLCMHSKKLCKSSKQLQQKGPKKEKGLIYLAVKAVAPLCLLLLLRLCPLSVARAWSGAKICIPRATWMWSSPDSHYLTCKTSGGPVKMAHTHSQHRCTPVKTVILQSPHCSLPIPLPELKHSPPFQCYENEYCDFTGTLYLLNVKGQGCSCKITTLDLNKLNCKALWQDQRVRFK